MGSAWVAGILAVSYAAVFFKLNRKNKRAGHRRLAWDWRLPFQELLLSSGVFRRLQPLLHRQQTAIAVLEGGVCPPDRLLGWTAEAVGIGFAVLLICTLLSAAAGEPAVGWTGVFLAGAVPALRSRDLHRRVEMRRQAMLAELPVLLSRLLVLVGAGDTVMRALVRILERESEAQGRVLNAELRSTLYAIQRGESSSMAWEQFGRRCAVAEAKLFAATVLMNARRGGEEFVPALRELTRQMWEKRKAQARTLGEQASSRLAFPLAAIFLVIVVLVGAPAVLIM